MPNPTTTTDLANRWRPLSPQEATNADAYLIDAWAMLLGRRPNLEADMADGKVSTDNVRRVVAAMVLRILKNPDGKASEGIDDYRYTRDELVSSGKLHVTTEELADVTPGRKRPSVRLVVYGES
jgi:hypothetical protein